MTDGLVLFVSGVSFRRPEKLTVPLETFKVLDLGPKTKVAFRVTSAKEVQVLKIWWADGATNNKMPEWGESEEDEFRLPDRIIFYEFEKMDPPTRPRFFQFLGSFDDLEPFRLSDGR
jgi:hypothetical protein